MIFFFLFFSFFIIKKQSLQNATLLSKTVEHFNVLQKILIASASAWDQPWGNLTKLQKPKTPNSSLSPTRNEKKKKTICTSHSLGISRKWLSLVQLETYFNFEVSMGSYKWCPLDLLPLAWWPWSVVILVARDHVQSTSLNVIFVQKINNKAII